MEHCTAYKSPYTFNGALLKEKDYPLDLLEDASTSGIPVQEYMLSVTFHYVACTAFHWISRSQIEEVEALLLT